MLLSFDASLDGLAVRLDVKLALASVVVHPPDLAGDLPFRPPLYVTPVRHTSCLAP